MKRRHEGGFTLIEIIITLAVGALLGAMLVPFLSSSLTRSGTPVLRLNETLVLQTTMENITADFRGRVTKGIITLADLQAAIGSEGSNQNNAYGAYQVVANRFITFVNEAESADSPGTSPQDSLKVTITDQAGTSFTTLFVTEL